MPLRWQQAEGPYVRLARLYYSHLQRVLDACVRLFRVVAKHLIFRCALPHDARRRAHLTHSLEPMTLRPRRVTILALLAFAALLYSTQSSQRYECPVTVEFKGGRQSPTASAASGIDESIGCARRPPANCSYPTL
jgi:hypothetical protein